MDTTNVNNATQGTLTDQLIKRQKSSTAVNMSKNQAINDAWMEILDQAQKDQNDTTQGV